MNIKSEVDLKSRIHGIGSQQLYAKSKSKDRLSTLTSSMRRMKANQKNDQQRTTRTSHVSHISNDYDRRHGPADGRSIDGAHVNQAYSRESDYSDDHTSRSAVSLSIINTNDVEARNETAKQVYL